MSNKNNTTDFHSFYYFTDILTSATALLRSPTQPPGSLSSRC
jgi:hypothetical protein